MEQRLRLGRTILLRCKVEVTIASFNSESKFTFSVKFSIFPSFLMYEQLARLCGVESPDEWAPKDSLEGVAAAPHKGDCPSHSAVTADCRGEP